VLWQFDPPDHGDSFRSSAAVTADAVIVGCQDHNIYGLAPATGQLLWTFPTQGRVESSAVIVGPRAFVGSADGRLYALDCKTGRCVWQFRAGGKLLGAPAVAASRLVIGSSSGQLYCFGTKQAGSTQSAAGSK
jgi:outer membrane protein assembly factor BamB